MNQRNVLMGNRILYNKSIERNQEIHLKKLREIKSNFRAKSPFSYEINKKKKEQLQETKHTEIERENRILLEKITNIMQNKQLTMSMKRVMSPKSLNQTVRKKKLVQIAEENQFLLRRLQEKRSNYDVAQYEQQWANTKSFINTITGYSKTPKQSSYYGGTPTSSDNALTNNQSFSHSRNNSLNPIKRKSVKLNQSQQDNNHLYGQQNSSYSNQNVNTSLNGSLNSNFRISQPRRGESAQVSKRSLSNNYNQRKEKIRLYKQVKVIGNIHFDVEIYMFDGKMMIVADEIEGEETKIIEIPSEEALTFLREECDNNLDSLVLRLRHANNQLFLIGTKKSRENAQQNSANKSNGEFEPVHNNGANSVTSQSNQQNIEQANFDESKISQDQIKQNSNSQNQSSRTQQRQGSSKNNLKQQNLNGENNLNQQNSNFSNNSKSIQESIPRGSQQFQNGLDNNSCQYRNTNEDIHENFDEDNQESVNDQLQYAQNMRSVKEEENDYFKDNSAFKSKGQSVSKQNKLPQNSHQSRRNEFEDNSPDKYVFEDEQQNEQYENDEDEEEEEEEEAELEEDYHSSNIEYQNNNGYLQNNNQYIRENFTLQEEEIDI
ncbi:hypothetical protein TTHERM_00266360 (macronuclear) [Tetrahymena thermophila SB210]|uniref:Uncharacterized protein n=1 Tax=Tetrahymena thermophila (strain SB210) TaxID=312017 RepID=I7LUP2_TETTS|nr:hypothetical protein TTHERM_00266360 [Tetrahymena thermophila SB210]EAR95626.2 hypothetical protein TTHERM_00266360 [Tetrahymena thermophila SB210]|eukprot:XP_001015871.2 hypothetical protein TTHERM_00266360 [Tetrahymena thermophila SB210]